MLIVYDNSKEVRRKIGKEPIKDIEGWFNSHIHEIEIDDTVKRIMYHMDEVEFMGHRIVRKKNGHLSNIEYLSKGAKAVICIYTFPKIVFDLGSDNNRVIACALTLPRGKFVAYIEDAPEGYKADDPETFNKVRVVTWAGIRICKSIDEVYQYFTWCSYYEPHVRSYNKEYYEFCGIRHGVGSRHILPLDYYGIKKYKTLLEKTGVASWCKSLEEEGVTIWYESPFEKYGIVDFDTYTSVFRNIGKHKLDFDKLEKKYKKLIAKRIRGRV